MTKPPAFRPSHLRRSVLSVPAVNIRALEKTRTLACDAVIFDLEDSVAVSMKDEARANLRRFLREAPLQDRETIIRINALDTPFAQDDIALVTELSPDAVLLPKVESPQTVLAMSDHLGKADMADDLRIWAMIETAQGVLQAAAIAETARTPGSRLDCFVVGLNDLRKDTGVASRPGREHLMPWLMQIILSARAYGLDVIDSVFNDFRDEAHFAAECAQGKAMGFSGKMLIHPSQIDSANRHFAPDDASIAQAEAIIAAFQRPEAADLNVIDLNGQMVERLHLDEARALVHKAQLIAQRRSAQGNAQS